MDVGIGGHRGYMLPHFFTTSLCILPIFSQHIAFFARESDHKCMCPHFLNASYFPGTSIYRIKISASLFWYVNLGRMEFPFVGIPSVLFPQSSVKFVNESQDALSQQSKVSSK